MAPYSVEAERDFGDAATGHGFAYFVGDAEIRFPRDETASHIEVWSRRRLLAVNLARNGARYQQHHPYVTNRLVTPNRCCPHDSFWHVQSCTPSRPYFCTECYDEGRGDAAYHRYGDFADYMALLVLLPRPEVRSCPPQPK